MNLIKSLELLSNDFKIEIDMEEIKDCLYTFNELLYMNFIPKNYEANVIEKEKSKSKSKHKDSSNI